MGTGHLGRAAVLVFVVSACCLSARASEQPQPAKQSGPAGSVDSGKSAAREALRLELKSERKALQEKLRAEREALKLSLGGKPPEERERLMKELRAKQRVERKAFRDKMLEKRRGLAQ